MADDTVVFGPSRRRERAAVPFLVVYCAAFLAGSWLITGHPPDPGGTLGMLGGLTAAVVSKRANHPPWLIQVSPAGLDLRAKRYGEVRVPWGAIGAVQFRGRGRYARMHVVPADRGDSDPAVRAYLKGHGLDRLVVPIGALVPGRAELTAALARHLPAEAAGSSDRERC